jgi:leucyl-tRNA synthetase
MVYNHKNVEKKWQKFWSDNETFKFIPNNDREKYYVLSMFPYPSGELHAGHLRNYVIGDIEARYKRMRGYNVLNPMGADAFGLPAENAAIKRKIHPLEWTKKNLDSFLNDMLSCGLSYDISRVFATCYPEYYGFQQEIFIKMFENGLITQKESYVNWDPVDQTVLANEQVINGRGWRSDAIVERKLLKQWFIKITDYAEELLQNLKNGTLDGWPEKVKIMQENWIGKSEGALLQFYIEGDDTVAIEVYTTRPDTLFGASFLGIAIDHPLAKKVAINNKDVADFIDNAKKGSVNEETMATMEKVGISTGIFAKNPFNPKQKLPIYIANFILMDYGTGAIFGCPAHDERDYEFAKKYNLPIYPVVGNNEVYKKIQKILSLESLKIPNLTTENDIKNIINDILLFYKENNNLTIHKELGVIKLTKKSIKDSLIYKNFKTYNDLIYSVLKTIPEIIKNSIIVNKKENWKNKKYNTYLLATNISLQDKKYIVEIVVKEFSNKYKTFYIHNIINKDYIKKVSELSIINGVQTDISNDSIITKNIKVNSLLIKNFIQNLPYTEHGISIFSDFLSGLDTKNAKMKAIEKIENMKIGTRKINYRLRDWGISRQRYWGCPIPMVHCEHCGTVPEKIENLPIKLPDDVSFDKKGNPLFNHPTWKHCNCPVCGKPAIRETDTMDTFVDSSWYFLRFIHLDKQHPVNKELVNKIMPIDQYVGGVEHAVLHLMYARFFTKVMSDLEYFNKEIREPSKKLLNQGMVQQKAYRSKKTNQWENPKNVEERDNKFYSKITNEELNCEGILKMSKSKLNVVGISDFMEEFGADSARLFVMSDNPITADFEWTAEGIKNSWKYLNRIYKLVTIYNNNNNLLIENHKTIKDVTNFMNNMEYNKAIARIREFTNIIEKFDGEKGFALINLIKLLAPFTPHICEELNEVLKQKITLDKAEYPTFDEKLTIDGEVIIAIQINGKIRGEIKVKKDEKKEIVEELSKENENANKYLENNEIKKVIFVPNKLISFVI